MNLALQHSGTENISIILGIERWRFLFVEANFLHLKVVCVANNLHIFSFGSSLSIVSKKPVALNPDDPAFQRYPDMCALSVAFIWEVLDQFNASIKNDYSACISSYEKH